MLYLNFVFIIQCFIVLFMILSDLMIAGLVKCLALCKDLAFRDFGIYVCAIVFIAVSLVFDLVIKLTGFL